MKELYEEHGDEFEEDDLTREFLSKFYDDAFNKIKDIDRNVKGIDEKYEKLIQFFGDTKKSMPFDTFIDIFTKFYRDLNVYTYLYTA